MKRARMLKTEGYEAETAVLLTEESVHEPGAKNPSRNHSNTSSAEMCAYSMRPA